MDTRSPWPPDTHRSERSEVQQGWATPLQNGDLQIVFAVQRYGGYRLSTEREGDPRYRYFIAIGMKDTGIRLRNRRQTLM